MGYRFVTRLGIEMFGRRTVRRYGRPAPRYQRLTKDLRHKQVHFRAWRWWWHKLERRLYPATIHREAHRITRRFDPPSLVGY